MKEQSFRAILAEFLEEKPANSPRETPEIPTSRPLFHQPAPHFEWTGPKLQAAKKNPYPQPIRRPVRVEKEQILPLAQLKSEDQIAVQLMIRWGARELEDGISQRKLKKAHRRLIKTLHPDHMDNSLTAAQQQVRHESFLALQSTYEGLSDALKSYQVSGSACGNESASAPGYRRQDAA